MDITLKQKNGEKVYTDWNVSKTIILNCTEEKGATYCRDLCYHESVWTKNDYGMEINHTQFMKNNNITRRFDKEFYQHEYLQ